MTEDATLQDYITHELDQRDQTGHETAELRARYSAGDIGDRTDLEAFLAEVERTGPRTDGRVEPDELDQIEAEWSQDPTPARTVSDSDLADKVEAAWLGRVAGNMLGKPVEEGTYWTRSRLREYLEAAGAWPLQDYIPAPEDLRRRFKLRPDNWRQTTLGNIDGSCRDDDVDYTILGLHILEAYGADFTTADVAREWLLRLPYHQTYTAERAAYRNLIEEVPAERAARHRNPYREWIGALIRADIFGYVSPGEPRRAAHLAFRDAALSHTGNGIYGEQWAAALVASAFTATTVREAVDRARLYVPGRSRLAEAIDAVTEIYDAGGTWDQALEDADTRWAGYHWVHTVNNAAVITAGLLWGSDDFTRSIALTVQGGLDTDSNAATVGSVLGIVGGTQGIDGQWTAPLRGLVRSAVFGFSEITTSELADRTLALIRQAS